MVTGVQASFTVYTGCTGAWPPVCTGQLVRWVIVPRGESAEADGCGGLPAAAVAGRCKLYSITARPCCVRGG